MPYSSLSPSEKAERAKFLWGIALKKALGAALIMNIEIIANMNKYSTGYTHRKNLNYYIDGKTPIGMFEVEAINLEK
jgi:hypothetical protein